MHVHVQQTSRQPYTDEPFRPRVADRAALDLTPRSEAARALQRKAATSLAGRDLRLLQQKADQRPNTTGLPNTLKAGVESLSGMSLDHVKVHYNSAQPAQLNALAYAQGSDIHVAPGQEKHLPHEAWHVVQQAQGRVQPTMQMKDGVPVNDDAGLEREADVMGAQALARLQSAHERRAGYDGRNAAQLKKVSNAKLNVIGEDHRESATRRDREQAIARTDANGEYWREHEFLKGSDPRGFIGRFFLSDPREFGDPPELRAAQLATTVISTLERLCHRITNYDSQPHEVKMSIVNYLPNFIKLSKEALLEALRVPNQNDVAELVQALRSVVQILESMADFKSSSAYATVNQVLTSLRNAVSNNTSAQVRVLRSMHMHASAQASQSTRGIWKIGDSHITDIAGNSSIKSYELMTRDEFNTEYFSVKGP